MRLSTSHGPVCVNASPAWKWRPSTSVHGRWSPVKWCHMGYCITKSILKYVRIGKYLAKYQYQYLAKYIYILFLKYQIPGKIWVQLLIGHSCFLRHGHRPLPRKASSFEGPPPPRRPAPCFTGTGGWGLGLFWWKSLVKGVTWKAWGSEDQICKAHATPWCPKRVRNKEESRGFARPGSLGSMVVLHKILPTYYYLFRHESRLGAFGKRWI